MKEKPWKCVYFHIGNYYTISQGHSLLYSDEFY